MRFSKRLAAIILSLVMLLSFAGCDLETTSSLNDYSSDIIGETVVSDVSDSSTGFNSSTNDVTTSSATTSVVGTGKADPPAASSIPDYSGKVFIQLYNNTPNFSAAELKTTGYEKYGNIDSLGRVTTAIASLGKDTMPKEGEKRGDISGIKPSGWVQKQYSNISGTWLYNRCHLIGWQLSAENANKSNLITGTRYFNTEGMLPFENMVADYIKETNNHVAYRVTPVFEGNDLLCKGVQIEAYSVEDNGKGISFNVFCYNVQPGITINYATGDSSSTSNQESSSLPVVSEKEETQGEMVWIPTKGGTKYHSRSNCSNMIDPEYVSKESAISQGFEACKRCY